MCQRNPSLPNHSWLTRNRSTTLLRHHLVTFQQTTHVFVPLLDVVVFVFHIPAFVCLVLSFVVLLRALSNVKSQVQRRVPLHPRRLTVDHLRKKKFSPLHCTKYLSPCGLKSFPPCIPRVDVQCAHVTERPHSPHRTFSGLVRIEPPARSRLLPEAVVREDLELKNVSRDKGVYKGHVVSPPITPRQFRKQILQKC